MTTRMDEDNNNDMSHENEDDVEDPSSLSDPNTAWAQIGASQVYVDPLPRTGADRKFDCTRLVLMSDTHGKHRQVMLPAGDCLIHGGDFTKKGEMETIRDLSAYFKESAFPQVIYIAGNHDITLHQSFYHEHGHRFRRARAKPLDVQKSRDALEHCTYLEDSACTLNSGGSVVYGSPWTPEYNNWAFNLPRGKARMVACSRID